MHKKGRALLFRTFASTLLLLAVLVFGAYTQFAQPQEALAATNSNLNFQARLLRDSGRLVPDGNYHVEFKLYDDNSAGNLLWTETRTTGNLVRVVNGYMSVSLGSVNSFPSSIDWDQELWLTMNIGGSSGSANWDGEMDPRIKLTGVPYAFSAGRLVQGSGGNRTTLDFASPSGVNEILLPAASGTICLTSGNCAGQGGTGDILQGGNSFGSAMNIGTNDNHALNLRTDGTTRLTVTSGGNVNITSGSLQTNGTTRITNSGVLQNVTASTNILTSGTLGINRGGTGNASYTNNGVIYFDGVKFVSTGQGNNGQCLTGTSDAPVWTSCDGLVTLQNAYTASANPHIILDDTRGGVTIRDASTPISGNLFQVQNNAGNNTYLGVSTSGIDVFGSATISNTLTVNAGGATIYDGLNVPTGNINTAGALQTGGTTRITSSGELQNVTANANILTSGTLADARLSSNVALLNANANFTANLQQGGNDVCTVAGNCAGQGGVGDILQGGNSFGTAMNIGTNDGFDLNLRTDGTTRLTVTSGGSVGIGTTNPQAALDVDGSINISDGNAFTVGGHHALSILDGNTTKDISRVGYLAGNNTNPQNVPRSTVMGRSAGAYSTGEQQSAFGYLAGYQNASNNQSAFGSNAGRQNIGVNQSAFGSNAGYLNEGQQQSAFGYFAGYLNQGHNQSVVGREAGRENTGANQSAVGRSAGQENTGNNTSFFGYRAGYQNTGHSVIAIGYEAGQGNSASNQFIVQQANVNATPLLQGDFGTGNLGIGTDSPSEKLHVHGNILSTSPANVNARALVGSVGNYPGIWFGSNTSSPTTTNYAFLYDSGLGTILNTPSNQNFSFRVGNSNRMILTSAGDIGIGTTSPSEKLHVVGNGLFTGSVTADNFQGSGAGLTNLNASNLSSGTVPSARISGSYTGVTGVGTLGAGSISSGFGNINIGSSTFTGNGSGLTNLNASNISSGTLSDARLSSNVARLNASANFTGASLQHNGDDVCTVATGCGGLQGSGNEGEFAFFDSNGDLQGSSAIAYNNDSLTVSVGSGNSSQFVFSEGEVSEFSFEDGITKLADPADLPANTGRDTAWSPDGQYLSVAHVDSPYITIYKRSGDTFTKLADPADLPAGTGSGPAWSPDGQYMSVAHFDSPYITIYKRSGDTFTKLADPADLPTGTGQSTAWSPDGQYMSVAHGSSPFVTIYKRSGDTFTKLADPADLPTGTGLSTAWSPDGQYLSVAHSTSPFVTIYKRSGDTFTKLANPADLPAGGGWKTAFSPDGQYLSVTHNTSPYITIYKRSGDTFTKLADPADLPAGNGRGTAWSPDGQYLSVGNMITSPYITIYKRSGDTFTKLADPADLPTGNGLGTAFSPDGQYLSVAHSTSPYITIYKADGTVTGTESRLGIGTTNPQEALHVIGNGLFTGNLTVGGIIQGSSLNILGNGNFGGTVTASAFQGDGSGLTDLDASNVSSGILSVGHGGTGVDSFTQFGLIYGNGSSSLGVTSAGETGECLVGNNGNAPSWVDCTIIGDGAEPGGTAGGDLSGTYPNPTVARINGASLGTTTADAGRVLIGSGSQWISRAITGDVLVGSTGTTTLSNTGVSSGTYGSASQVATFEVNPQGRLVVAGQTSIAINGNQVTSGTVSNARLVNSGALTVTAGTGLTGGGSVALGGSTTINLNTTYLNNNYFAQGGNAFGATATMGTTDNNALRLITNNNEAMRVDTSGNVGINTANPQRTLDVAGEARVQGSDPEQVTAVIQGAVDQTGGILEVRTSDNTPVLFAGTGSVQEPVLDWVYTDNTNSLSAVAVSPDGNTVYVGGQHDEVHAVDASDGSWQWTYSGHSNSVAEITVSPDGNTVYSGSQDTEVHAINASNGTQDWAYTGHSSGWVYGLVVSPDGNTVYSGTTSSGEVHALNASNGSFLWDYTGHSGTWVRDLAISPNGEVLYTASNSIHAIDTTNSGAFLWDYTGHSAASQTLELNSDGSVLYSGARDDEVHAIDTSTEAQLWNYVHDDHVAAVIVSPDDSTVYAGSSISSSGGGIWALDADNGGEIWFYDGHANNLTDLAISSNGETLYSTSIDNEAHAINLTSVEKLRVGIGTDSPEAALHVAGDAIFRNETDQEQAFSIQDAAGNTLFNTDTLNNRITLGYQNEDVEFTKISDPSVLPPSTGNGIDFSPDGQYMAVAHNTSPFVSIYKRDGDGFVKLSNPTGGLPPALGNDVAFSPNGQYLAVAHNTSPYITIYKRDGDSFAKLSNPGSLPASTGTGVAWSPSSEYLSVSHLGSPFSTTYRRSGDSFAATSLAIGSNPASSGRGVAFSSRVTNSGLPVSVVAHDNSPYLTAQAFSAGFKLSEPFPGGISPGSNTRDVAFSPDGNYLSVVSLSSPYVHIYEADYNTSNYTPIFTKLSNPADLPSGGAYGTSWSPDGRFMMVTSQVSPQLIIYEHDGQGGFTRLPDPDDMPPSSGWGGAFSPDGRHMGVAHSQSPFVTIYDYDSQSQIVVQGTLEVNNLSLSQNLQVGGTIVGQKDSGDRLGLRVGRQSGSIAQFVTGSSGTICQVTTSFSCSSDERLKTNIEDMSAQESLDKIMQLGSVNFNWLQQPDGSVQSGFIAQQVQEIMPELVEVSENGYLTLDKAGFVPYLVGGMQQQQGQIISLQGENASQSSLIDSITERVDDIEEQDIDSLINKLANHKSRLDSIDGKLASGNFSVLNVSGPASVSSLTVSGSASIGGNLSVGNSLTVNTNLRVKGTTRVADLYVDGKLVTRGDEPDVDKGEALDNSNGEAEVKINGNDNAGAISVITGQLADVNVPLTDGVLVEVTFSAPYNKTPRVVIMPTNSDTVGLPVFVQRTATGFKLVTTQQVAHDKTYSFDYIVLGAE